jgi:hypothetical protein
VRIGLRRLVQQRKPVLVLPAIHGVDTLAVEALGRAPGDQDENEKRASYAAP